MKHISTVEEAEEYCLISKTDEEVFWYYVDEINELKLASNNLKWLIPLACDESVKECFKFNDNDGN
jgi:hypothetical protein